MTDNENEWEHYDNAPSIQRDPETGRILKSNLTPDRAREIASSARGVKERAKRADQLAVNFMAIVEDRVSPEKLRAVRGVVEELARVATENKSGAAVSAIQNMLNLIGEYGSKIPKPARGDRCPTCGEVVGGQVINVSIADNIDDLSELDDIF